MPHEQRVGGHDPAWEAAFGTPSPFMYTAMYPNAAASRCR